MPKKRKTLEAGQQFGLWTVLRVDATTKVGQNSRYICECICGTVRSLDLYRITGGYTNSCGCKGRNIYKAKAGDRFNRWEVIKDAGKKNNVRYITCRCQCGYISDVQLRLLLSEESGSCGCLRREINSKKLKSLWAEARKAIALAN